MADATVAPPAIEAPARDGDTADLLAQPHRRYNPLTDEWILVSTDRIQRPLQGRSRDARRPIHRVAYDPGCYLCPGNVRASGEWNPAYRETFVFTNDYAALRPDTSDARLETGLLRAEGERGTCRVICFSPRHDLTMARMSQGAVRSIVDLWADQTTELGRSYRWVQVFENRGEAMGASNPHPHGQIWAGSALPVQATREDAAQRRYHERTGQRLLLDYVAQETGGPRVVVENDEWQIVVPFWAAWPFETLVVAKRPVTRIAELAPAARDALAVALIELLSRYDNLFRHPFPYSMGWHQAPFDGEGPRPLAAPRPLLPAAPPLGHGPQVHGRLRAPGRVAARPDRRGGRGAAAGGAAGPLADRRGRAGDLSPAGRAAVRTAATMAASGRRDDEALGRAVRRGR